MNNKKKKKILCWADSALAGTGFGVVAKNILFSLYNTGQYHIDHLAINCNGDFYTSNQIPWQMQPARLLDPRDPHGMKMFSQIVNSRHYDIVLIINDLFVTHKVAKVVEQAKNVAMKNGATPPVFVYYYPVDCCVPEDGCDFLKVADISVAYNTFGKEETTKVLPDLEDKIKIISHGVNTGVFFPASTDNIKKWRKDTFNIDDNTIVVLNVNRNSTRKQMPYSILAFKEFRKHHPDSIMYFHTQAQDQGGNMIRAAKMAGLEPGKDVFFPANFSPNKPYSEKMLHQIYNCADLFLTTHLGEGFGLTAVEAAACNIPVVIPNNTSTPDIFGECGERGYVYECKDTLWIDESGYRPKGLIPDIVEQMNLAVKDIKSGNKEKTSQAYNWAINHDWSIVNQKWIELFNEIEPIPVFEFAKDILAEEI